MYNVSIKLKETANEVSKIIMSALRDYINPVLDKVVNEIQEPVADIVKEAVNKSNEIQSIYYGELRVLLGFANPDIFVKGLLEAITKDIYIKKNKLTVTSNSFGGGGLQIRIIKSDYSQILNFDKSSYESSGIVVPWLHWLLFDGTETIIYDYDIRFGNFPRNQSRTGQAIMVPSLQGFSIPPTYAGRENNNFITRSLNQDAVYQKINQVVINSLEKNI